MLHLVRRGRAVGIHLWHFHGAYVDRPHQETFCPRRARAWVLLAAILASSMGFMDRINTSIAMPMLREDLAATLADAQWISNSYLLSMSSLILMSAAVGQRFGLRQVLVAGIGLFTAGAVAVALADGVGLLIGVRAVQGIGGALMVPTSLAIIAKAYPKGQRGKAIGIWAAASSILLVVGPLIGGFLVTATGPSGWRVLFALNLPLGGAALLVLLRHVPADDPSEQRGLDIVGGILVTCAMLAIAFALTTLDQTPPGEGRIFLLLCGGAGALLLVGFIVREARAPHPLVPLGLFANKGFSGANAVTFLNDFAISANLFFLPMTVISGWGETAAAASVLFLPLPILLTLMSEPSGQLTDRFGPAPLVALGSLLVACACAGLGATTGRHDLWSTFLPLMCLMAFGQGLLVSPLSTAVMTSEDDKDAIVGSGVNNAISRSAWLLSVAAMGAVASLVFAFHVAGSPAADASVSFGVEPPVALSPEANAIRIAASDHAFSAIAWITAVCAVASALIGAMTLQWKRQPG
jgi:MFS family permease